MSEVMERDTYYSLLELAEETVEESKYCEPYTVRHSVDEYTLNYEYEDDVYKFDLLDEDGNTVFSVEGDLEYAKNAFRLRMGTDCFDKTRSGYQQGGEWYGEISKPGITGHSTKIGDMITVNYQKRKFGHVFESEGVATGRKQCTLSDPDFNKAARDMMEDLDACGAFDQDDYDELIGDEGTELADIASDLQGGE